MDAFGSARDEWIETDFQGWLGANTFYEVCMEIVRTVSQVDLRVVLLSEARAQLGCQHVLRGAGGIVQYVRGIIT